MSNPSLKRYNELSCETLTCPCSRVRIVQNEFISLSPRFHEICSSNFVDERWITILMSIRYQMISSDWLNHAGSQFELLSELCQLSAETIKNGVNEYLDQSLISSTVINEKDFEEQMKISLEEFILSRKISFGELIDLVHISFEVDQPFVQPGYALQNPLPNGYVQMRNDGQSVQVCLSIDKQKKDLFLFSLYFHPLKRLMFIRDL